MKDLIYGLSALVLLAAVACAGGDDSPVAVTATTAPQASPVSEQAAMARAAAALRSYRATLTVELPNGTLERGTFAIVLPDRSHFSISFSGGAMTNEMVVIGNDRYARMGQGWTKVAPMGLPRVLTSAGGLNQLDAFRTGAEASALAKGGADSVDGKQCQVYTQSLPGNAFEYCVADNLPLRMKVTQGATAVITFIFSDFNQVPEISPPI